MRNLHLKKVSLLTDSEMQELTGGQASGSSSATGSNDCNYLCKSSSECKVKCKSCRTVPNWVGIKVCDHGSDS